MKKKQKTTVNFDGDFLTDTKFIVNKDKYSAESAIDFASVFIPEEEIIGIDSGWVYYDENLNYGKWCINDDYKKKPHKKNAIECWIIDFKRERTCAVCEKKFKESMVTQQSDDYSATFCSDGCLERFNLISEYSIKSEASIICPYCHKEQLKDTNYYNEDEEDEEIITCSHCKKDFTLQIEYVPTFTSVPHLEELLDTLSEHD